MSHYPIKFYIKDNTKCMTNHRGRGFTHWTEVWKISTVGLKDIMSLSLINNRPNWLSWDKRPLKSEPSGHQIPLTIDGNDLEGRKKTSQKVLPRRIHSTATVLWYAAPLRKRETASLRDVWKDINCVATPKALKKDRQYSQLLCGLMTRGVSVSRSLSDGGPGTAQFYRR